MGQHCGLSRFSTSSQAMKNAGAPSYGPGVLRSV